MDNSVTTYDLLCLALSIGVSGLGSYALVAYYYQYYRKSYGYYSDNSDNSDDDGQPNAKVNDPEFQKEQEVAKYVEQYYDELEELPSLSDDSRNFHQLVLIEGTPRGTIYMYYDRANETFAYYCNDRYKISYKLLDTVARKYAIAYNCRHLCLSSREELNKAKQRLVERRAANRARKLKLETLMEEVEETSVFAKFKSYNNSKASTATQSASTAAQSASTTAQSASTAAQSASTAAQSASTAATQSPSTIAQSGSAAVPEQSSDVLIRERSNRFTYKGKLADCKTKPNVPTVEETSVSTEEGFTLVEGEGNTKTDAKELDYATFKQCYLESVYGPMKRKVD